MSNKVLTDLINWLVTSGWLAIFLVYLWHLLRPLVEEKRKHAKTAQQKELLGLIEQLADNAVTSLVSRQDITGSDKFKAATKQVQLALESKGLSATDSTIESAIQSAYEKSDLTPTVDPNDKPQTGVVIDYD
jgi:hypothetical protein